MSGLKISVGSTVIEATSTTCKLQVYNCLVSFIRMTILPGALGNAEVPTTLVTLMSHIKWTSGSERIMFNKETHYLDAILRCRKPAGITIKTTDKMIYNGETYEIVGPYDPHNLGTLLVMGLKKIK